MNKTCVCGALHRIPVGDAWFAAWRDPSGRYVRRKIGARRAAQRVLEKVRTEIAEGKYVDRRPKGSKTLADLQEAYCKAKTPRESSAFRMVCNSLGHGTRVDKISASVLEKYANQRINQGKKPGTVRREFAAIGAALSLAVRLGWILAKPQIPRLRVDDKRTVFLSREEAHRLTACASHDYRPLIVAALQTGMRQGELLAMTWDWINLRRKIISIPPESTKTNKGRHVPISGMLIDVLNELGHPREGLVFVRGSHWWVWAEFRKAAIRAGLEHVRFHDLRHTAASWMVQSGKDLYRVAEVLGHKDYRMTQRYAHLQPGHLTDLVECLSFELPQETEHHGISLTVNNRKKRKNSRRKRKT